MYWNILNTIFFRRLLIFFNEYRRIWISSRMTRCIFEMDFFKSNRSNLRKKGNYQMDASILQFLPLTYVEIQRKYSLKFPSAGPLPFNWRKRIFPSTAYFDLILSLGKDMAISKITLSKSTLNLSILNSLAW